MSLSVLVVVACVSGPRALTPTQLEALSTRQVVGDFDEVFDATWLSLEHEGLRVSRVDRVAGTLLARRPDGTGYDVSVTADERAQRVRLFPVPERATWVLEGDEGETARWDAIELHTTALLAAWREVPEWAHVAEKNLVTVPGVSARLPEAWEKLEPSVSRRVLTAQRSRTQRRGLNPTWRFEVKRRTPRADHRPFLLETAGAALFAGSRLTWPDDTRLAFAGHVAQGRVRLGDGEIARPVTYAVWVGSSEAFTVRIAAICGPTDTETACAAEWRAMLEGLVARGVAP
ncbi:MAG: hypothetical protein SFW67_04395 [Myxococcaceae bacterium]|nr:hypothetical protein [Myxococcaceae bacterium]